MTGTYITPNRSSESSGEAPRKLTRAERKLQNKAAALRVQAEEYAAAAGVPPTLAALQAVEAEKLAAPLTLAGGTGMRSGEGEGKRTGRPSEFTEEQADQLCAWIAGGGSLRAWCRETGRGMETVYRWLREHALFRERYARAHEDRADTLADEMLEIADQSAVQASIEGVAAAKLRVETRRFIASKLRPQKWGERQTVEHVGAVNIRIGIPAKQAVAEAVDVTPKPPKLT